MFVVNKKKKTQDSVKRLKDIFYRGIKIYNMQNKKSTLDKILFGD